MSEFIGCFGWAWEHYAAQPDPLMTRTRAAGLLRAWRRARIQGRRTFALKRHAGGGARYYFVEHSATGETATLVVKGRPL